MDDIHGVVEVYGTRVLDYNNRFVDRDNRLYILSGKYKRMMFGMEPEEISSLYEEHSTVIQSVREGIIVIDKNGMVSLVNQAAYDILSLDTHKTLLENVF